MPNRTTVILALVAALAIFSLGSIVGYGSHWYLTRDNPTSAEIDQFSIYWQAWRIIEDQFYGTIPADPAPAYAALRGALASLNDPYTLFVAPEPRALEKADLQGEFGGIGAYITRNAAGDVVLTPLVGSPAEQAGVQKGDVLIQVDQTPISSTLQTSDVVLLIRGKVGSQVRLTLRRAGTAEPVVVSITRQVIETPSVEWHTLDQAPNIGYIRIHLFTERTNQELTRAIQELRQAKATSLILDLRDDGGGLLDAAVDVASQFLDKGAVLYEDRRNAPEKTYPVKPGGLAQDLPLTVLVNGGTASASEIVAGALQDHQRATLIGQHTYGKGSVQLVYDLSDQSSLHVTVARWLTPDRRQIDSTGLTPDIEVAVSDADKAAGKDPVLERAVTQLQGQ